MSNKIKLKKNGKSVKYKKIKRPAKITFKQYLGDFAGCGIIRIIYPSLLLNSYLSQDLGFESIYDVRYNPDPRSYGQTSFVVFQRSSTKQQVEVINHFKQHNPTRPLVYEIDDNLFDIPKWNFAHPFYKDNKKYITQIMRKCNGIIVSTKHLKQVYSRYNNNIQIIPNHLPKFVWGDAEYHEQKQNKVRICYPGSFNHFAQKSDEGDMSKEFIDFIKKTKKEYQWVFVGGIPNSLTNDPDIEYYGWQDTYNFPRFLHSLNIDIMLAPLQNIRFNKSKSNIKALEATAIGSALICSDIDPYHNLPGVCDTTPYMIDRIQTLAIYEDKRKKMWQKQYNILKGQLFWEENDNLLKYVDSYLKLTNTTL